MKHNSEKGVCKIRFSRMIFLLILSACFPVQLLAQTLTASVSKNPVSTGEQFQLTFTVNANGTGFTPPPLNDFMVLSGPNQSTSMQFVNGNMSQSISLSYYLQAKTEGTFTIGAASISCSGKKITSAPLTLKVVKDTPPQQDGGGQQQGNDEYRQVTSDNLFLKVSVDKSTVFQGEALVATYKIFTTVNIVNYAIPKMPALSGFWTQEMQMPPQVQLHNEVINGVTYSVGELRKVLLFPQQSGTLTLDPMQVECIARIPVKRKQSNNPFDIFNDPFFNDPFFGSGASDMKVAIKSAPVKITVKPLPSGAPEFFNGAVGHLSFEAALDKSETRTNDPVTLKIRISGKGNLKLIDAPVLNLPSDIESYDPKVNENVTSNVSGSSGTKIFEYLLIPRHQGTYEIDPVSFCYFDLDKRQYISFHSPRFELKVAKGSDESAAVSGASKSDIQVLGNDIRFIKTGPLHLNITGNTFYLSWRFFALFLLPFIIALLAYFWNRKNRELNSNIGLVKSRKANKMARKRLALAGKLLQPKDREKFYDEIFKALWGYISDKLGIPPADLSKESASLALREKKVSEESVKKIMEAISYCEFARFAPQDGSSSQENMYRDAIAIISNMENEITGGK